MSFRFRSLKARTLSAVGPQRMFSQWISQLLAGAPLSTESSDMTTRKRMRAMPYPTLIDCYADLAEASRRDMHAESNRSMLKSTLGLPHWMSPTFLTPVASAPNSENQGNGQNDGQGRQRRTETAVAAKPASIDKNIFNFFEEADFHRAKASFRFEHAVAGFAKHPNRPVAPDTEVFQSERFGEDACFRRHDSLGVADGVGGITLLQGGNSSLMSRKLMHYVTLELDRYDNIEDEAFAFYYDVDPVKILKRSYKLATADMRKTMVEGATTACIVVLRDDELRIANLGDSGVLVIRQGDFVFRTEAQQRSFNVPYQLGLPERDSPDEAQQFTVKLERGDIVILATDGMFDNLFDEDIADEVAKCIRADARGMADPVRISRALASRAREVSEDSRYATSPFQSRAVAEGFYYQGGGKLDDITVIVAVVSDLEDTPDRR